MKVMYWNCTAPASGGTFPVEKVNAIAERIRRHQPDIVCLDEMSGAVTDVAKANTWLGTMATPPGGLVIATAYQALDVNVNPGIHLNTVILVKTSLAAAVKVQIGLPGVVWDSDGTKRDLLRAQYTDRATARIVNLWFIHANASPSGGSTAVRFAAQYLAQHTNDVFIGDFNNRTPLNDIGKARMTRPVVGTCGYTQWQRSAYKNDGPAIGVGMYAKPGGMIDFALSTGAPTVTVTALDALDGLASSTTADNSPEYIQKTFDHFPIVYSISCP